VLKRLKQMEKLTPEDKLLIFALIDAFFAKSKLQLLCSKKEGKQTMQTLTIDIINTKAIRLLQDLELLQLIRVRRGKPADVPVTDWATKYKGAMTKQPLSDIDGQLNELRDAWE
jgi:hypothetical protein